MSEIGEKTSEKKSGRRAPIVIAVLIALTGAAVAFRDQLDLPDFLKPAAKSTTTAEAVPPGKEKVPTAGDVPLLQELQSAPPKPAEQGFDIARIAPEGISVFAGRGSPNSTVAVIADGVRVGTAKVDENGEWTLSTEHKFANADPKLALEAVPEGTKVAAVEAPPMPAKERPVAAAGDVKAAPKPAAAENPSRGSQKSAEQVTTGMIQNLERLVEQARKEDKGTQPAPAPAAPQASSAPVKPPESVKPDAAPKKLAAAEVPKPSTNRASDAQPQAPASIPVPITFEYRTSNFTSEGRRAALLLSEYLKLKGSQEVSLTGHADDRGSDELNMDLSQERLDAVAALLRETGFSGQMNLQPKGKREPFSGVDRSQYSQEALYQLDRRVELRLAQ